MTIWHKRNMWVYSFSICLVLSFVIMPVQIKAASSAKPVIKIGVLAPMKFTGGQHQWEAAVITAEEINASGGVVVNGTPHEIMLVKADSNEFISVIDAVNALERLLTIDKVNLVVGSGRSEATMAYQELLPKYKVILQSISGHPEICLRIAKNYEKYKYLFRPAMTNLESIIEAQFAQIDMVLAKIRNELKIEKPRVALMMDKAVVTEPIIEAAKKRFPQKGIEIVGVWRTSSTANDMTAEFTAVKDAGAHVIFTQMSGPSGPVISRQWGEFEIPTALAGLNIEGQSSKHWEATGGKCNYEVTFNTVGRTELSNKTLPFLDKMMTRFGHSGDWGAYAVADSIWIWKEAVERAGTWAGDAVVAEMEKTDYRGVQGRIVFGSPGDKYPHDVKWGVDYLTGVGVQWQEGKQVVVWPDGNPVGKDDRWKRLRFKGTLDYKLPLHMVKYWTTKKDK